MLLPDGSAYEGAFAADGFEARGTYEYGGGRGCHAGEWRAGRKHGKARQASLHAMHTAMTDLAAPT